MASKYCGPVAINHLSAKKKMRLKMLSAEVVSCKKLHNITDELSIEAYSVHTVGHRGFLNISADKKSRRPLLRLAH